MMGWHSPLAASLAFFLLSFYILLYSREKDDASRLSDTIKLQRYNHQVVNSFSLSLSLSLFARVKTLRGTVIGQTFTDTTCLTRMQFTRHRASGHSSPRHHASRRSSPWHLLTGRSVSGHFPSGRSRVRVFSFWMQPCQGIFLLDAAVSGHFPSGRSRVTAFSFWTLPCQGKWRLDDACHGTAVMLAVKAQNIAANTLVTFVNTQRIPGIVTQSSSIHSI